MAGADPGVSTITEPNHDPTSPPHDRGHAGPQPVALYAEELSQCRLPVCAAFPRLAGRSRAGADPRVPQASHRAEGLQFLLQRHYCRPALSVRGDAGTRLGLAQAALPKEAKETA